jgi:hypothetical protein
VRSYRKDFTQFYSHLRFDSEPGDRILDEVLEIMATSAQRNHSVGYWVDGEISHRSTCMVHLTSFL